MIAEQSSRESSVAPFHAGPVSCVDMRADGLIASGGYDGVVGIWEGSGRLLARLRGHQALVNGVAWSPGGERIASASSDHTARIWSVVDGREVVRLVDHADDVNGVAWSPDASRVATACFDGVARIFEVGSGRLATELRGHAADVNGVAWSPDGLHLATASDDRTARLWSPEGRLLARLEGHTDWVDSVCFSPDGRLLATASLDRTARIYDTSSGRTVACLDDHQCTVKAVRFSPDGRLLATAAYDKRIRLYDTTTWEPIGEVEDLRMWNRSLGWGRSGRLATGSFGGAPVQWRIGEPLTRTRDRFGAPGINGMAVSPAGTHAALACDDGGARIVSLADGRVLRERFDHEAAVLCAAWTRDGRRAAFGGWNDRVSLHDGESGQLQSWIEGVGDPVNSIAFAADGRTLALGSFMGSLSLWDVETARCVGTIGSHEGSIKQVVAVADGWATAGRDGCVRLHGASGTRVLRIGDTIVNGVAVAHDGRSLAVATRGAGVLVLDARAGEVPAVFDRHPVSARAVAFAPGGRWIAAGYYDGHVLLADLETGGERLLRPFGPTPISGVAFGCRPGSLVVSTWDPRGRFGVIDTERHKLLSDATLAGSWQ